LRGTALDSARPQIRRLRADGKLSQREVARIFGVPPTMVYSGIMVRRVSLIGRFLRGIRLRQLHDDQGRSRSLPAESSRPARAPRHDMATAASVDGSGSCCNSQAQAATNPSAMDFARWETRGHPVSPDNLLGASATECPRRLPFAARQRLCSSDR